MDLPQGLEVPVGVQPSPQGTHAQVRDLRPLSGFQDVEPLGGTASVHPQTALGTDLAGVTTHPARESVDAPA